VVDSYLNRNENDSQLRPNKEKRMITDTDPELERYYNSLIDIFLTEGWKSLLEDFTESEESLRDLVTCKTEKELHYRQGQLDIIGKLLSFEDGIKNSYEDFINDSSL